MAKKTEQNQNNENAPKLSAGGEKKSSNKKASTRKHAGSRPRRDFQWGEVDDEELGEVITPVTSGKKKKRRKSNKSSEDGAETRFQIYHAKPRHEEDPSLPSYGRLLMGQDDDEDEAYSNLETLFGGDDDEPDMLDAAPKSSTKRRKKKAGSSSAGVQTSRKSARKKQLDPVADEQGSDAVESARTIGLPQEKPPRPTGKNVSTKRERPKREPEKNASGKQDSGPLPKSVAAPVQAVRSAPPKEAAVPPKASERFGDDVTPRRIRGLKRRTVTKLKSLGVIEERIAALIKLGETSPVSVLFHMLETLLDSLSPASSGPNVEADAVAAVLPGVDYEKPESETVYAEPVDVPSVSEADNLRTPLKKHKGKNKSRPAERDKIAGSPQNKDRGKLPEEITFDPGEQKSVHSAVPPKGEVATAEKLSGFASLGLSAAMLHTLAEAGYENPTPVQTGTIQHVLSGIDLIGQAKTGTGKTAAFAIPIIEQVAQCTPGDNPVALVVVPTRELAVQVRDEMVKLGGNHEVAVVACYGGKPISDQIKKLSKGVDVVVGTPGRILDLVKRRALSLDDLRWVVLDEADRMLDIGFRPDIERILKQTPLSRQTLLFSATLPPPVTFLARKYMKEPKQFDFSEENISAETIEQYYITVDADRKFDALIHLIKKEHPNQAIVFCRTKRAVDRIGNHLQKLMSGVSLMHGDLSQDVRDRVMRDFRAGKVGILVATDVVGRGIDVSGISHIINYDIPEFCDDYVHRVGRTGRMGREGVAFTLVTSEEGIELTRIEKRINQLLTRAELPGFQAFTVPGETESEDKQVSKPVFGHSVRRVRRAL